MKPYNRLNDEDKKMIVDSYYNNYEYGVTTFKDVAKSIGVSERAFSRVLREEGVNTKRKNKYTLDEDFFENINTEIKAYLVGLLFADGCVTNYNYIVLQQSDKELVEFLKDSIGYTGEIIEIHGKDAGGFSSESTLMYRIHFSSEKMSKDLISLGKHNHMEIHEFPKIPKNLLRHFIRGYFDGDGGFYIGKSTSYFKDKKYVYDNPIFSIICTKGFANNIKSYFCNNVGIETMQKPKSRTDGMVYIETRSRKNCVKIYHHLYDESTIYLKRKHDKFKDFVATYTSNSV